MSENLEISNSILTEMLGPDLAAGLIDARERLSDNSLLVRITMGLASIERGGVEIMAGLSQDDALSHLAELS